jgi:predicted MFS family arabinose efflux permease
VAYLGFEFTIVSAIPVASEVRPLGRARFLAWMVVAMSIGRGAGAAIGPVVFAVWGVAGNALAAALVNVVALGVLVAWVRDTAGGPAPLPAMADSGGTGRRS